MVTQTLVEVNGQFHIFDGDNKTLCGLVLNETGRAITRSLATDCKSCEKEYKIFLEQCAIGASRFMGELFDLYKKYNLSISHEDDHGAFIITEYTDENKRWIENASLEIFGQEVIEYGGI